MNADGMRFGDLSGRIIGCAMTVSNALGVGFLEKVYENALAHELRKAGLEIALQTRAAICYDGVIVGEYMADITVEELVLVELKAVRILDDFHRAQCINYLKPTGLQLCLLINFGNPRLEFKRLVL
jgi:GxxExxY protein